MKTLVITDGLFNDYTVLNSIPFEEADELHVFVTSKDKNRIDLYFKEEYPKVSIIKKIQGLSKEYDKIWVFRTHEKSETPYELIEDKLSGEVKFRSAAIRPRFTNFRNLKLKSTETLYTEMGINDTIKLKKTKIKDRIKKMKAKAKKSRSKTKTKATKPKKPSKPSVRLTLKTQISGAPVENPLVDETLAVEAYD